MVLVERTLCANTFLKFFVVVFSDAESSFKGIQAPAYLKPYFKPVAMGIAQATNALVASCALVQSCSPRRTPQNVAGGKPSERRVASGGIVLVVLCTA